MSEKDMVCIVCPVGCDMHITINGDDIIVKGNKCPKGIEYAKNEMFSPMRNIASSVIVENGEIPLVSVRLSNVIPKNMIFPVMNEIQKIRVSAPVLSGDVIVNNILGLECDLIATRTVKKL